MQLEALVREPALVDKPLVHKPGHLNAGYSIVDHVLDFRPLLAGLLQPGLSARDGAALFHRTLIAGLAAWIGGFAVQTGHTRIVLGGGCLMNRILAEGLTAALRAGGLEPWLPRAMPANDGGLSFGQAAVGRAHLMAAAMPSGLSTPGRSSAGLSSAALSNAGLSRS